MPDPLLIHGLQSIAADIMRNGAAQSAVSNTSPGEGMLSYVRAQVENLEGTVHTILNRLPWNDEANPAVFPVTKDGGQTWSEMVMVNGELAAHPGGRIVTDDADICAFREMTENQGILIEMRDSADPTKMRYLLVSGGEAETVGQYQGMSHVMVSDNADGWDFGRATPPIV